MISLKNFFSQIFHVISSNLIRLIVVGLLTILVPRFISVEAYGYWQLYIFYTSYVGFFHFGWCDGIYLKEGGKKFDDLDQSSYKTQFLLILILEIVLSIFIFIVFFIVENSYEKQLIVIGTCFNAIIVVPCTLLNYLMQTTGKIKEFSYATIIGRIIYFTLVILSLITSTMSAYLIIIFDLFGWIVTLGYSCYVCKDIFKSKFKSVKETLPTIFSNISIGSKLMIANIASTLIIGIVRFNIESNWSIEIFGKISLCINLCNLVLIFINAISLVIYPILKKMENKDLSKFYDILDLPLTNVLFFALLLFFPINYFIKSWLPQYEISAMYMAILFPICIYESKVSLLIYTFLKVLRKEKIMMIVNLFMLILSFILSYITVYIFNSLLLTIYLILILLFLRCILLEVILGLILSVSAKKMIFVELLFTVLFLFSSLYLNTVIGFLFFFFIILIYLYIVRKKTLDSLYKLKELFI